MDGHKETIGLAVTQRECSCSSVGRAALSSSFSVLSGKVTETERWRHQQSPHRRPFDDAAEPVFLIKREIHTIAMLPVGM